MKQKNIFIYLIFIKLFIIKLIFCNNNIIYFEIEKDWEETRAFNYLINSMLAQQFNCKLIKIGGEKEYLCKGIQYRSLYKIEGINITINDLFELNIQIPQNSLIKKFVNYLDDFVGFLKIKN